MKVNISHKGKVISTDVSVADNFWSRLSGYMFKKEPHVSGILFEPASAMQTTFMFFELDIVFLTKDNRVIKILRNVKPWRHTWFYSNTRKALEVPSGNIPLDLQVGDVLEILSA
ncbi:MAG TPA: DUF192 domain-containing protein [Bacteriovoracaceae bacterium]|nr:DUF192 domain-containing protein [Bacteriovoracaceae bacterium]